MGPTESKELIQNFWDLFSEGNYEAAWALLDDDFVLTVMGTTGMSGTFRGKENIYKNIALGEMELIEPLKITIKEMIAEGERVVCLSEGSSKSKQTGKPYNNKYCMVYRVKNGKIAEAVEYLDTALTET